MARYMSVLRTEWPPEQTQAIITEYLQGEGFKYIEERGERIWRKGVGALANPQFIKVEPSADGTVRIEAWTAGLSVVPGVYTGELNPMEGVFGWGPKLALKPRIRELERRLGGAIVEQGTIAGGAPAQLPPAGWHPDPTGRHEQRYWDGSQWTANIADAGQPSVDPEGAA
jgi:hypothetical protein